MKTPAQRILPTMALLTLVLLYLVVAAGAIVRATGSGMGCPDWPKCYGQYIPPVSVGEIDFSKLDIARYRAAWQRKGHDPLEVTEETLRRDFDARSTWIEFINRIIGALSGLAALATFLLSVIAFPRRYGLLALLAGQLVLFGLVAWLGKVVVDTNLLPWKITMHMGLAVALITTSLLALHQIRPSRPFPVTRSLRWNLAAALVVTLVQIFIGTQVREVVDHLGRGACCDGRLEHSLGIPLIWHRVGAIVVISLVATVFFRLHFNRNIAPLIPWLSILPGLVIAAEYGAGVLLVRAGLPGLLQPVHLVLAVILHGMLLTLILRSRLHGSVTAANGARET